MDNAPDTDKGDSVGKLARFLTFLLGPSRRLNDPDVRRRSLLLTVLLLVMVVVFGFIDTTKSLTQPGYSVPWIGYLFIVGAFVLNRRGFFGVSSWVVLVMFPTVLFSSVIVGRPGSDTSTLSYLLLGIMLASLLRRSRETLIYAGINLAGILLLPILSQGKIGWDVLLTPLAINGIGTALTLIISHYRDLQERDRQRQLSEGRRKYQELVETTNDWTWEVSNEGVFTYVAPQVEQILGYSPDKIVGESIFAHMPAEDAEKTRKFFRENLQEPSAFTGLISRHQHKDSHLITLETSGAPVFDNDGNHAGYRGINRDVSEREELSGELKRTAALLGTVLDSIPDIIGILDMDHNVIRYNAAGEEFWREKNEDRDRRKCFELIGRTRPCLECAAVQTMRTGEASRVERFLGERGVWFDIRSYPVKDASGETTMVIEHLRDISDRKKTGEVLRQEHDFRQAIIQTASEGICVWHTIEEPPRVRFSMWNQKMEEITGFTMEEINKIGWLEALYPDTDRRAEALGRLQSIMNGFHLKGEEQEIIRADGEPRIVDIHTAELSVPGQPRQVLSMVQDVTERRHAEDAKRESEERLRQAEKLEAIGLLAGGIAHDFNNQLSGILGFADILHTDLADRTDLQEYVQQIVSAADRSAKLTQQLLSFARKGKLHHVTVHVHEIIEQTMAILSHSIDKRIALEQSLEANPSSTMGDPAQLQSAMLNIAINARDAMPNGGVLRFATSVVKLDGDPETELPSAAEPGEYVQISIRDNGVGMNEETLHRVFEPFFTTKDSAKGTGLGLSAAYGIVEAHSGFIQVESEPGKGTEFKIHLPTMKGPVVPFTDTTRITRKSVRKLRVLVIDDEPVAAQMCGKMLNLMGHEADVHLDCDSGTAAYSETWQDVDLVILDMIMPKKTGVEVFQDLRRINPEARVVICSGFVMDDSVQKLINEGARGFVNKPYKRATLANALAAAMEDL